MSRIFMIVFLIFGTVVGSGFSSGKEIMVYFSRFGNFSYLYILLAGILFFFLFYFFLRYGRKLTGILEKSKLLNIIVMFISLVFCSSMFAGVKNLFSYFPMWAYMLLNCVVILCCILVTLKGIGGLERVNLFLMPAISVLFLVVLIYSTSLSSDFPLATSPVAGLLFSPLYVALNTSMSGIVIAKAGENLSKKQTFFACLFSTLLIMCFLFLGNFVLRRNGDSYFSEMPFLFLASENSVMFLISFIVILSGCFTTLISLCFTLKSSFEKLIKNNLFSTFSSVFLPFFISTLGFSHIVSFLYPICSVLGVFVLFYLLFGTLFPRNKV